VVSAAAGQVVTIRRHLETTHAAGVLELYERHHAGSLVNLLHAAAILATGDT